MYTDWLQLREDRPRSLRTHKVASSRVYSTERSPNFSFVMFSTQNMKGCVTWMTDLVSRNAPSPFGHKLGGTLVNVRSGSGNFIL